MASISGAGPDAALVRAIGTRALAAAIVNVTVGAGIFVLPAAVALRVGAAAPLAYLACAVTMALIVTCLAMAGSRVGVTGGLYAYAEAAFGPFVGCLGGVLYLLTNLAGAAGVASALVAAVSVVLPAAGRPAGRAAFLVVLCAGLAAANIRGVRTGARIVEAMTVAKLAPLAVFVAVGVFYVNPSVLAWPGAPSPAALGDAVLLLIFAFVGIEVALLPSGEVKEPERTVPRAIYAALATTTLLYVGIQVVAQGVLGGALAQSGDAPLADASARFLGQGGKMLVLAGGVISMLGYMSGDMLGTPRLIFAFARDGFFPAVFARVHPRHRTPFVSIAAQAALVCGLAIAGTFTQLVLLTNVSVLSLYLVCCAGAWRLARRGTTLQGRPFVVPGGAVVPTLACGAILWILSHATAAEFGVEAAVLAGAALLYFVRRARVLAAARRPPNE